MSPWRLPLASLALVALLAACSGGDDGGGTAAATGGSASTAAPATSAGATPSATGTSTPASPATSSAGTTAAATTVDEAGGGDPAPIGACALLDAARIEAVLGGPVSKPTDLETSCEWTVGDEAAGVSDTLTLTVEGTADDLADTADLLGDAGTAVPEAGDGGVYWADFTTLYFVSQGRLLSLQFLAPGADDPLAGLVALANRVG